jgi:hypothetical protein
VSESGEYIVEFTVHKNAVKVTAVDPETMLEVSIVGSTKASKKQLSDLAIRKLKYMQRKKKG